MPELTTVANLLPLLLFFLLPLPQGPQYIVVYFSCRSFWSCYVGRHLSMAWWVVPCLCPGSELVKPWAAGAEYVNLTAWPRGGLKTSILNSLSSRSQHSWAWASLENYHFIFGNGIFPWLFLKCNGCLEMGYCSLVLLYLELSRICTGKPVPVFSLSLPWQNSKAFMFSLVFIILQAGCWEPLFVFQRVALKLQFVISLSPTDPGLPFWEHSNYSICSHCSTQKQTQSVQVWL